MRNEAAAACHACMKRRRVKCNGRCLCHIDLRDIKEHIEHRYCPAGKYEWEGFGSLVGWTLYRTGCTSLYHRCRRLFEKAPKKCGCAARQKHLDNRFRGLWLWLMAWRLI